MKAHELLSSPDNWCQGSPAEDAHGNKVPAFHPAAVKWCAFAAIQKVLFPFETGCGRRPSPPRAQRFRKRNSSVEPVRQGLLFDGVER